MEIFVGWRSVSGILRAISSLILRGVNSGEVETYRLHFVWCSCVGTRILSEDGGITLFMYSPRFTGKLLAGRLGTPKPRWSVRNR